MDEQVDVQALTIGVGTVIAVALLAYSTVISETIGSVEATALATGAFAGTFLAIAVLHGAYGRRDFAGAHALAGIGMGLVAFAASPGQVAGGLLCLVVGGSYIAVVTIRQRREAAGTPS